MDARQCGRIDAGGVRVGRCARDCARRWSVPSRAAAGIVGRMQCQHSAAARCRCGALPVCVPLGVCLSAEAARLQCRITASHSHSLAAARARRARTMRAAAPSAAAFPFPDELSLSSLLSPGIRLGAPRSVFSSLSPRKAKLRIVDSQLKRCKTQRQRPSAAAGKTETSAECVDASVQHVGLSCCRCSTSLMQGTAGSSAPVSV